MINQERISYLVSRVLTDSATPDELHELTAALGTDDSGLITRQIEALLNQESNKNSWSYDPSKWSKVADTILQADKSKEVEKSRQTRIVSLYRRVAVAAVILLAVGLGTYFLFINRQRQDIAKAPMVQPIQNDVAPGGEHATLTLADGRKVVLDSASGSIAKEGGVNVINLQGKLAYNPSGNTEEVLYNTISVPKGGQYQLVLADGSKVWLNAASSLRFPTAFTGKERTVELTGEGYFEVAHNEAMPFHVKVNDMDVQVIGTHFNINAYGDEPSVKTTLLEGKVLVKKNDNQVYLSPDQQAVLQQGQEDIRVNYGVDVEEVVAWKNGQFQFNSADVETVMRQVARWYDVEVVYQEKIDETISGTLPRSQDLSQLLKILEATGKLDLKIRGKQVIVRLK